MWIFWCVWIVLTERTSPWLFLNTKFWRENKALTVPEYLFLKRGQMLDCSWILTYFRRQGKALTVSEYLHQKRGQGLFLNTNFWREKEDLSVPEYLLLKRGQGLDCFWILTWEERRRTWLFLIPTSEERTRSLLFMNTYFWREDKVLTVPEYLLRKRGQGLDCS